jgi:AraC-like DNA-binding protein
MRPLTMARIARHVGMSAMRLNREFERVYGEAPRTYLLRCRMEAARQLLDSGRPPQEVALRVGYAAQRNFESDFKRWFGMLPGRPIGRQESGDG